jgi:hypothetical protein
MMRPFQGSCAPGFGLPIAVVSQEYTLMANPGATDRRMTLLHYDYARWF